MCLLALALPVGADEVWLSAQALAGKPFSSQGYDFWNATEAGLQLRAECLVRPSLALGLGYGESKIMDGVATANQAYATLSVRWMPWDAGDFRPYALLDLGAMARASSSDACQTRDPGLDTELSLGALWSRPRGGWAVDLGLAVQRAGDADCGLATVHAYVGLQTRFGAARNPLQAYFQREMAKSETVFRSLL
ncbi:MAG TPA: hypothetical protein VNZ54_04130 [bacterium]|nr:hypothetical protein [bacterium]